MGEFTGKVAFVTGAASGIGRAVVDALVKEGAKVAIVDMTEAAGKKTEAEVKAAGGDATFFQCDVSNVDSVNAAFDAVLNKYGRVDFGINNAGIDPELSAEKADFFDLALYDKIQNVNMRGVLLCMQREVKHMLETGGGKIVNTASMAGIRGIAWKPFYCTAKHGVVGLTKAAALQFVRNNININAVCPGMTQSAILEGNIEESPEGRQAFAQRNPIGRIGQASELADAILWLCSEKASFVVGQAISVDGGSTAR